MKLPKKVKEALKFFVKECKKKFGKDLVSVILFGSYARGNWKEESDIDLLVVVKGKLPPFKERHKLLEGTISKILKKYCLRVMPIISSVEELNPKYLNPLLLGILVGHIVLVGKEFWRDFLFELKPTIKKFDPIYIEGETKWRVKDLIEI